MQGCFLTATICDVEKKDQTVKGDFLSKKPFQK